jgi:hypothetical protein
VGKASGGAKAGGKARGGGGGAAATAATEELPSMDDLLPRADISGQITGELISKLNSSNWHERKEGLDLVEGILTGAGGRIQPGVSVACCGLQAGLKGTTIVCMRGLCVSCLLSQCHRRLG